MWDPKATGSFLIVSLLIGNPFFTHISIGEGSSEDIEKMEGERMESHPFAGYEIRWDERPSLPFRIPGAQLRSCGPMVRSWSNDDPANDDSVNASVLTHGQSLLDQHVDGTQSGTSDVDHDWYCIWLNGSATHVQPERLNITVNRTGHGVIAAFLYDPVMFETYMDLEYIGYPIWENVSYMDVVAHMTGWYHLLVQSLNSTEVGYNIENVTITTAPAGDGDDFMWSSPCVSSPPVGRHIRQNTDHWDFYNISGMLTQELPEGKFYDVTATVNVLAQNNPGTDFSYDIIGTPLPVYAWTMMTYFYNDANDPGLMHVKGGMVNFPTNGGSLGVLIGSTPTVPFSFGCEVNGTLTYIGICTFAFNIVQSSMVYSDANAWADYDFTNLQVTVPNTAPYLSDGMVEPPSGTVNDSYTFSVEYKDNENHPWTNISMILNPETPNAKIYGLQPDGPIDHKNGSICSVTIDGTSMMVGVNTFKFKATDIRDATRFYPISGGITGPIINSNHPVVNPDAPTTLYLLEDQPPVKLNFTELFCDPDEDDAQYLYIWDDTNDIWENTTLSLENFIITIDESVTDGPPKNQGLIITPEKDAYGSEVIKIMGTDEMDPPDYGCAVHTLTIDIQSVNDAPEITHVGHKAVQDHKVNISGKEEHWTNLSVSYIDVDTSEHVLFSNIFGVYPELTAGVDMWIDENTSKFGILFSNNVTGMRNFTISIEDKDPLDPRADTVTIFFEIENINDPPIWSPIPDQVVKQGQSIEFKLSDHVWDPDWNPKYNRDPDPDMGDYMKELIFFSNIDDVIPDAPELFDLLMVDDIDAVYDVRFDLQTTNSMVGEYDVTFYAADTGLAESPTKVRFVIENVNDPPQNVKIIQITNRPSEGSDIDLKLEGSADDPDLIHGDILNFTWLSNATGVIGYGETLLSVHLEPGYHLITLLVTDSGNLSSWTSQLVFLETTSDDVEDNATVNDDEHEEPPADDKKDDEPSSSGDGDNPDVVMLTAAVFAVIVLLFIIFSRYRKIAMEPESQIKEKSHFFQTEDDIKGPVGPSPIVRSGTPRDTMHFKQEGPQFRDDIELDEWDIERGAKED